MRVKLNSINLHSFVLLTALVGSLFFAGCSGKAKLNIMNNTSRYASGDVDGNRFGVTAGGSTIREVEVGGFLRSSSEVEINVSIHCSTEMISPVVGYLNDKIKMQKDHEYWFDVYYSSSSGTYRLRLQSVNSHSPILRP